MKSIIATTLVALAIATSGAVTANAADGKFDAAKFFQQLQLNGH